MAFTKDEAIKALKGCFDPELQIDVWTLGLVYDLQVEQENVKIKMTLTSPACPYGPALLADMKSKLTNSGAKSVDIELVFDPPWKPSQEVQDMLGIMGL